MQTVLFYRPPDKRRTGQMRTEAVLPRKEACIEYAGIECTGAVLDAYLKINTLQYSCICVPPKNFDTRDLSQH